MAPYLVQWTLKSYFHTLTPLNPKDFSVVTSQCRILVVDDLEDNLFLLQTILEAEGYQVDLANNGQAALQRISAAPPSLVLLDVMMPGMNGYEVTQRVRQMDGLSGLPIILITAFDEIDAPQKPAMAVNDFIRKPIDLDELLNRVKAFCPA